MSDLSNLPAVQFADLDAQEITNSIISGFESAAQMAGVINYKLYSGDPRRLFLNTIAKYIILQNHAINEAGKSNLLAYARDAFLDQLAALYGARGKRLAKSAAVTTIEYTLSVPQANDIIIPKGSRVSPGNNIFFATDGIAIIRRGEWSTQIEATCTVTGESGNGFEPGEINIIVDRNNPFVNTAVNITTSSLGADEEGDDSYRERLYLLPESFSVAGSEGAYRFWAKTASQDIVDVGVFSPEPGVVHLYPLMKNGELPTEDVLDKVYEICSDKTRRPMTDNVFALAPDVYEYDLSVTYYISRQNMSSATGIQRAVEEAVSDFVIWQKSALRRDLNPDELIQRVKEAGAKRLDDISINFRLIGENEVAIAKSVSLIFGGFEDGY